MAFEFGDTVGHYTTLAQCALKWGTASGVSVSTGQGPRGGNVIEAAASEFVQRQLASKQTRIIGHRWRCAGTSISDNQQIIIFYDNGTNQVDLRVMTNGSLRATRNGTTLGTSASGVVGVGNVWYYIEFKAKIDNTTGTIDVWVNDVNVLSLSGIDTQTSANATCDQVRLIGPGNVTTQWCDLYILNSDGATNNARWGDVAGDYIPPSGTGNSAQFTPSTGANWENVDDTTPNDDTNYNSSSTAGNIDLFAMTDVAGAGSVKAAQHVLYHRKDDAGARSIRPVIRSGGSNAAGNTYSASDTYKYDLQQYDVDPVDSSAWTLVKINALEAGYELVA